MVKNYVQNNAIYGVGESVVGQVRKANEDNCGHASTENGELFVVCDGMGGHVGGATASDIGVRSIIEFISRNKMEDKRVLLAEALKFANMQIFGRASEDATLKGMGTTACIALIDGDNIWLAHVGDSRIYLYSAADKFLYRVTKDHSFVQGLVDSGQLDDRDAENHPQKNIIMRALGIKEDVKPEVAPEPMHCAKGDIIMICSDGLSGMIDDVHIEKKIRENKADLADLCQQLIDDANTPDKGKDNITCQLIRIEASAAAAAKHPDYTPKWRTGGESGHGGGSGSGSGGSGGGHTPTPNSGSKLWLWISLAAVLILLGAGVIFAILYVNNNRHMFKRDVRKEIKLEEGQTHDLNDELRDGITNVKEWKVMNNDVHIDGNGLLTIDSTYVTEPSTCIKVVAIYDGKTYHDSVFIHLEYLKSTDNQQAPVDTVSKGNEDLQPQPDNRAIAQQYADQAQQSLTRAKTEAQKATKPDTKQKAETELVKVKKAADEAKKAAENEDVDLARQKAREANIAANKVAEIVKADAVTTTQSAEYVLMVRPVGSTPNFAKDGDGIKPYAANSESAHVIAGDECVVYLVKKTGEQKTPVNAKADFRKDNIEITDMGSQNGIHWYKCSIVNGQETGVFSYVYDGKKIKIQLSK